MKITSTIAALLLSTATLFGGNYMLDDSHTSVDFKIKHMMITNVSGKFKSFYAEFAYDEKTGLLTKLEATVDVNSIDTGIEKRDNHLRSADFFDVANHPEMKFVLDKAEGDEVTGTLTIRGISKKVTLEYENGGVIKDPWGNQRAGFSLSGKIDRKDFGLTWNKTLETGGLLVGDKVKISIDVEGIYDDTEE